LDINPYRTNYPSEENALPENKRLARQ
jgi:hypothetical protein